MSKAESKKAKNIPKSHLRKGTLMKRAIKKAAALLFVLVMVVGAGAVSAFGDNATATVGRTISYYTGATPEGDYAWFTGTATEYTLTSADQLVGLANLVNSGATTMKGVTIKLGVDMVFNEGDASAWNTQTEGMFNWNPIGNHKNGEQKFEGVFDGQGHFISGIYSVKGRDNGFFLYCDGATVKNFSLVNSVFLNNGTSSGGAQCVGSIVGRAYNGTKISNVYSDAKVQGGYGTGGLVGYIGTKTDNTITVLPGCVVENCVYAGRLDFSIAVPGTPDGTCVGGLIGADDHPLEGATEVSNCIFTGTMYSKGNGVDCVMISGLVGKARNMTISNCINAGTFESTDRVTTSYANITHLTDDSSLSRVVNNCYVESGKMVGTALFANEANLTSGTNNMSVDATTLKSGNLAGYDFTSKWTAVSGDYPMPTGVYTHYSAVKAIDFTALEAPAVQPPADNTGDNNTSDNNTSDNANDMTDTVTPETTAAPETTVAPETTGVLEKKGSCGSALTCGMIIPAIFALGAAVSLRSKKKDK